jgi:hypothetical protein
VLLPEFDFHKREGKKHYVKMLVFCMREKFEHFVEDFKKITR